MNLRAGMVVLLSIVAVGMWGLTCVAYQFDEVAAGVRPLDPKHYEALTIVTAGTGGAYENPNRLGPVVLVGSGERVALVDVGRGAAEALRAAEVPIAQPTTIYLSSLSPENTVGLDDLLLTGWLAGREAPLRVYGPPGTATLCAGLASAHASAIAQRARRMSLPEAGAACQAVDVRVAMDGEHEGLRVRATPLDPAAPTQLAWRFDADGRSAVVAPAPGGERELEHFAAGAHLIVRAAAYAPSREEALAAGVVIDELTLARDTALHSPFREVGRLPEALGIPSLVLVRVRPPPVFDLQVTGIVSDAYAGTVHVADDGDSFTP